MEPAVGHEWIVSGVSALFINHSCAERPRFLRHSFINSFESGEALRAIAARFFKSKGTSSSLKSLIHCLLTTSLLSVVFQSSTRAVTNMHGLVGWIASDAICFSTLNSLGAPSN